MSKTWLRWRGGDEGVSNEVAIGRERESVRERSVCELRITASFENEK